MIARRARDACSSLAVCALHWMTCSLTHPRAGQCMLPSFCVLLWLFTPVQWACLCSHMLLCACRSLPSVWMWAFGGSISLSGDTEPEARVVRQFFQSSSSEHTEDGLVNSVYFSLIADSVQQQFPTVYASSLHGPWLPCAAVYLQAWSKGYVFQIPAFRPEGLWVLQLSCVYLSLWVHHSSGCLWDSLAVCLGSFSCWILLLYLFLSLSWG